MPTTSQGIYYPNSTTDVAPLHTVFSAMASSIDDILAGDVQIHKVANTTQRNALVAQFPPSAENPLFVWRLDAPAGRQIEYTKNGTTWYYVNTSEDDTGWQSITPSSGFAASNINVRRIGKLVVLRISNLTRASGSGAATAFVIPPGFRPTEEHYPAWSSPSPNHTTWITTGGEVRGNFTTTGNIYRATTVYPVA